MKIIKNGRIKSISELRLEAIRLLEDAIEMLSEDDALELSAKYREENGEPAIYTNEEDNINEAFEGWTAFDILNYDGYDVCASYLTKSKYGDEVEFTDDLWDGIGIDMVCEDLLAGICEAPNEEIQDIVEEYEQAKHAILAMDPVRKEGFELLERYVNCTADVTDLLQYIDKLVKNESVWRETY